MILLIAWEALNNPMYQPKHKCKSCDTTEGLAQCPYCGEWVCGKHRVGTGSLSDGYACNDDAFAAELGQPRLKQSKLDTMIPPSMRVEKPFRLGFLKDIGTGTLGAIIVVVLYCLYRMAQPLHH
jgi:hypothetical protein